MTAVQQRFVATFAEFGFPTASPEPVLADDVGLEQQADLAANRLVIGADPPGAISAASVEMDLTGIHSYMSSPGAPLDAGTRSEMEAHFGRDFGKVRLHADDGAARSARRLKARAYTLGSHVVFGQGAYRPDTIGGRWLLAHELAHVDQQTVGRNTGLIQRKPSAGQGLDSAAIDATTATGDKPVVWGLDMSSKPAKPYASVTVPGHTLAEVATYLYGSPIMAAGLRAANGQLPERLSPGRVVRLSGQALAGTAQNDLNRAVDQGTVLRTEGAQSQESAMVYRFTASGVYYELTEKQYVAMLRGGVTWMGRKASFYRDRARDGRWVQEEHVKDTNAFFRGVSDLYAGQTLPPDMMWEIPERGAQSVIDSLAALSITPGSAVEIETQRRVLEIVARALDSSFANWNKYIQGSIAGAEQAANHAELVRNVSFGVLAGLTGAVVGPAVFALVAPGLVAAGATATTATLLATTAAVGGGAVAGGVVRGGMEVALPGATTDPTLAGANYRPDASTRFFHGLKTGAIQGGIGAAGSLAAPGVAAAVGTRLFSATPSALTGGQQLVTGAVTGAAIGAPSGAVAAGLENLSAVTSGHMTAGQYFAQVGTATVGGALLGGALSVLPINGLYRAGGVPFVGEVVTPRWTFAGPFSPIQAKWTPPADFNALPITDIPPLPNGYAWMRLNGTWEPICLTGRFGEPLDLAFYGTNAAGRPNYNVLRGGRLVQSSAATRPSGGTSNAPRGNEPMTSQDFAEPGPGGRRYIRGHNVDRADTIDAPGTRDSNIDPANFTPEPAWWGLWIRNNLVNQIRALGGGYRQVNVYSATPRVTTNGTRIPDFIYFVHFNAAGKPVNAWRIPWNATGPRTLAALPQFAILVSQVPPIALSPVPALSTSAAGAVAAAAITSE
jgi:hypothetical protein